MAMMISKFHRLIQSKALWAAFLLIVVFTFVIWGTALPGGEQDSLERTSPGKLDGEYVDPAEYGASMQNAYLSELLNSGNNFRMTREREEALRDEAWRRVAALREAKNLGLSVSPSEVVDAIRGIEWFAEQNGQFSKQRYKAFVQQALMPQGFSEIAFERYVTDEVLLSKLRAIIGRSSLVPPSELRKAFSSYADRFQVAYTEIGPDLVRDQVKVGDVEARAYFDKDPKRFTRPEMAKIRYVTFDSESFRANAKVESADIQAFYDKNMDLFLKPTNEVAATTNSLSTNALFASRYRPFEDVRAGIESQLLAEASMELSADRAMEMVLKLTPDRSGKALSFDEAARLFGCTIQTAGPFSERQPVKGIDAGPEFNRSVFTLTKDEEGYFTEPIRGDRYVYVAALEEKIPSRIPAFDEVKNEVIPLADAQALSDALGNKARAVREAAMKAVKDGKSFADALAPFKLNAVTTPVFSMSNRAFTNEIAPLIMRGVMPLNQGEVSEMLPYPDAVYLAHVISREPGDPTTFDSLKREIESALRMQKVRVEFAGWQDALLERGKLEKRTQSSEEDEEDAATGDAEAEAG